MEGVTAHEVDGGEVEAVLALYAVVAEEGFGGGFEFFELGPPLIRPVNILRHHTLILINLHPILFQPTSHYQQIFTYARRIP